eukprot:14080089-Ditylum_brightwellii.AAC.1
MDTDKPGHGLIEDSCIDKAVPPDCPGRGNLPNNEANTRILQTLHKKNPDIHIPNAPDQKCKSLEHYLNVPEAAPTNFTREDVEW